MRPGRVSCERPSGALSLPTLIGAIASLVLAATPAMAQTTFTVQDYLPLAVGNSWTFLHMYKDERSQTSAEHAYHGSGSLP